MELLIYF